MSSTIKLLPCPFCSNAEIAIKNENPKDNSGGYFIECPGCGASTALRFACGDDPTPILTEAWNRRTTSHCLHQIQEPEADIWPCVNIDVDESGKITNAKLYSPGLPAGNHDVYPVRVPYMDEHTEAWRACVDELEKAVPGFMSLGNMNGIECAVAAIRGLSERAKHQEPAAAEQAAWHAGLDEGRAQAARPVVVPDDMPSTEANTKYGESYGVEWVYEGKTAAPAAVAEHGSREERMVVLKRGNDGIPTVWCDPEIADIVGALNSGGVKTVASCSGHGEKPGGIALADGRQLLLLNSLDAFNSAISTLCPSASAPAAVAVPDERAAFEKWWREWGLGGIDVQWEAWQARAALAATPAAVQTHAEAAAALCINSALTRIRAGNHAEAIAPLEHALRALGKTTAAAEPVVLPEPAAIAISKRESATKGTVEFTWGIDAFKIDGPHALFTEQQVRTLLAIAAGLPRQPHCSTCNDHGAVGNILTAEPCPDCTGPAQADARDAARYQYALKNGWPNREQQIHPVQLAPTWGYVGPNDAPRFATPQDAIDAAIAAAKGSE